ncbi:MAG: hypothetical protein Ct9H90mP25_2060 [Gammaproteobacteria bacterium]|nr:MAG: hypothetical protein Ct9H90mP25_2060 [Gammaproteobacteria bacterium]
MTISAGDVVVIPAGVLHGFRKILDQITYPNIRIDPDQVFPRDTYIQILSEQHDLVSSTSIDST